MKIAYCIIAHRNNKILRECIEILYKNADIYLHVDKKSDINCFEEYRNKVSFIQDRVDVRWGSFSQIEATLKLLEETRKNNYDYIFLLSGDCLPIKSSEDIYKFLEKNKGKEFIALDYNFKNPDTRVGYTYTKYHYRKNRNIFEKIIVKLHKIFIKFFKNKDFINMPILYKGTSWFGITNECRDYIFEYLKNHKNYIQSFKKSFCGDEVFFHSIIFNSKYKESVYNPDDKSNICYQALRYIDWKKGPDYPRILDESDFDDIKKAKECLFARKFNENIDINNYRKVFIES